MLLVHLVQDDSSFLVQIGFSDSMLGYNLDRYVPNALLSAEAELMLHYLEGQSIMECNMFFWPMQDFMLQPNHLNHYRTYG